MRTFVLLGMMLLLSRIAEAKELRIPVEGAASVVSTAGQGVAITFDLEGVLQDQILLSRAYVEFDLSTGASNGAEVTLWAVLESWDPESIGETTELPVAQSPASGWDIAEEEYPQTGGLARLELTSVLDSWLSEASSNFGIVIQCDTLGQAALAASALDAELVVSFVQAP